MRKLFIFCFLILLINTSFSQSMKVFGVREDNGKFEGVEAVLTVNIKEGTGHVYIDTNPLTQVDTQTSARLAKEVACNTLSIDCKDKDFFYSIQGDFPMIGGPSAGAAMTILTIATLEGVDIPNDTSITGTINPDGSIGNIGGLKEKALKAQESGIRLFIIPAGQMRELENVSFDPNFNVIEASTVQDAYAYITNIRFDSANDTIYFDEFESIMKPMSEDLINYSLLLWNETFDLMHSSNISEENMSVIMSILNTSYYSKDMMIKLYNQNNYYSSASYAVGLSVQLKYINYLINYFNANNKTEYLNSLIRNMNNTLVESYSMINRSFKIDSINDIEAINIAIDRYFEALDNFNSSFSDMNKSVFFAMYDIAFSNIRLKTSQLWFTLVDRFEGNLDMSFNQDEFKSLALRRIENSQTILTYAYSLTSSSYLDEASALLEKARKAYYNGNYIYSIFESLESLSNSNIAMQYNGMDEEQILSRLNVSLRQARININTVQSKGIIPILAFSYYEYAQSFINNNETRQAILFLDYSKQFSLLSYQMVNELNIENSSNKDVGSFFVVIILLPLFVVLFSYLFVRW